MKNELQTLRLFSPLFPHIYRDNEWGVYESEPEDELKGNQTLSFCMSILKSSGFAAKEVMEYQ